MLFGPAATLPAAPSQQGTTERIGPACGPPGPPGPPGAWSSPTRAGSAVSFVGLLRRLAACTEVSELLDAVRDAAVDLTGAQSAAVHTEDLPAWAAILERAAPAGTTGRLRLYDPSLDRDLMDEFLSWFGDAAADTAEQVLLAPLVGCGGGLLGVLSVELPGGRHGSVPPGDALDVIDALAAQAAQALQRDTRRLTHHARHRQLSALWDAAFGGSPVPIVMVDPDGVIGDANAACLQLLGYDRERLVGMDARSITDPQDRSRALRLRDSALTGSRDAYQVERTCSRADGTRIRTLIHAQAVRDHTGHVALFVVHLEDITARTRAERRLARQATHDWLTDLPNRASIEQTLSDCLAADRPAGVLCCDVDRFKVVNESLGHEVGDELLMLVAHRLSALLPEGWVVGRVGGDEFVVVAPGVNDPARLRAVAQDLAAGLRRPLTLRGYRHTVDLSVGAAVSAPWHRHADEVLREADHALARAKRQGRGRIEVYDPAQDRPATTADLELEADLRSALSPVAAVEGQLRAYYQPVVDVTDSTLVGLEALVRWAHPTRGLLHPADFLPLADESGLVAPLGAAMLLSACRAASALSAVGALGGRGADVRWIAVNASGRQLGRGELPEAVRRALGESGLPARALHLEITETALVEASPSGLRELHEVADLGVSLSLDDFGTGYSSLSLLRDLPVSTVKIDRSFIAPVTRDQRAAAIVRSVVGLCRDLEIVTIAEGVETAEQLAVVRALGCGYAQGYLFGAPAALDTVDGSPARLLDRAAE